MGRKYVGAVRGGHPKAFVPKGYHNVNALGQHAIGRAQALADSIIHAAYLKSKGNIPNAATNVFIKGADFQDFHGTPNSGYVMAHRLPGSIYIGNKNLSDYAGLYSRYFAVGNPISNPTLLHMVIAPQAQTDPIPRSGNYADTYLESFLRIPLAVIVQHMLSAQKSNHPLEKNALVDFV